MPTDPLEEWRRLTALYSEMGDIEIQDLADQINDLTPTAQQILRDELKKRDLANANPDEPEPSGTAEIDWEPINSQNEFAKPTDESDGPHEYTWKVLLCTCESIDDARRIAKMLKRAGIDCWIESSRSFLSASGPGILVGADQLEQAKRIAAQPVPQDILDEERDLESAGEYELPTCPHCGAPDPILESVEPSNNWLCESCDHTWSEPVHENSPGPGTASGS